MPHPDLKWPKLETAKQFEKKDSDRLCSLLNNGSWKSLNKPGFFKLRYFNPKEVVFQKLTVTENVFDDRKKKI